MLWITEQQRPLRSEHPTAADRDEIMAAKDDKRPSQRSVSRLLSQHAQHHGLILGVAGQNPAFPMAARLGVRWVAAHMLAGVHLPVEAIELMVAAAFLPGASVMPSPGESSPYLDSVAPSYTPHFVCVRPSKAQSDMLAAALTLAEIPCPVVAMYRHCHNFPARVFTGARHCTQVQAWSLSY